MKILIVNTVRFRLNGITSVIMNYYRNMNRTGMQIDFVVKNEISEEFRAELEGSGATVHYIPRNSNPLKYMRQLYRVCKDGGYDVVHIHGNSAMMLLDVLPAVWARVPVRIVHSHNTTCSHVMLHKLLRPLFHRSYTHGFACGEDAGKWLYGRRPFTVLKNGIELAQYRYDPAVREEYRNQIGAGDRTVIGHVGNFIEQKNHTFLLDWFAELVKEDDRYLLLLLSDGALLDEMKAKAHRLGLDDKVLFMGKSTKARCYFQAMDLFVLPSLHEGLPVVLVEAQAAGLPCLVADTVAAEANLTGTLRYLPINSTRVWVDAVRSTETAADRAAQSDAWIEKITEAGYDVVANANCMKELYEEYCRQRKKGE